VCVHREVGGRMIIRRALCFELALLCTLATGWRLSLQSGNALKARGRVILSARLSSSPAHSPTSRLARKEALEAYLALFLMIAPRAARAQEALLQKFTSSEGDFAFEYPADFQMAPKLLKTHQDEVRHLRWMCM
jgi:hypothetical protein